MMTRRVRTWMTGGFLSATLWVAGGGAVAQDGGGAPGAEETRPAQAVAVRPVAGDDQIEDRLRRILTSTGWFDPIVVAVKDGVVFLDGAADSSEHKTWARDLAAKTQDAVAVVNRIQVKPRIQWSVTPAVQELNAFARSAVAALPLIVLALLILPLAWLAASRLARLARYLLKGRVGSPFLRDVIARVIAVPVFLLGLYIVLQVAGLTRLALSIIGGAGVVGIVVGFAFRDIAENFLASLLLSVRQPFQRGDHISVDGQEGMVDSMNTRSTVLVSAAGNHIQIPNATVFKSTIVNYSATPTRRETLDVGIGYDVSIADAQEIISGVLRGHAAVVDTPLPLVLVDSLGASTVNLRAYFWVDGSVFSVLKVKSALLRLVKKTLIEAGVSMPDDAREVIFPQGIPLVAPPRISEEEAGEAGADGGTPAPRSRRAKPGGVPPVEPDVSATAAEGDLETEQKDLKTRLSPDRGGETDTDLLGDPRASLGGRDRSMTKAR